MTTVETRSKKAVALSAIIRLCADLERQQMAEVLRVLRNYIAACDEADQEIERELSEVGALVGAAVTADECRLLVSQLLAFVRTGKRAQRGPHKPLRKFALVGGGK